MLKEDNDMICRIGPGTPMGGVFRRYWTPIALATQVAAPDGAPARVQFAGESYVLFRDSDGRLGLLDELCAHRGASLVLGRNEECGLRCLYHGWKYDVEGNVLDMLNVENPGALAKFQTPSYPVREAGGLIWGYFGPADKEPAFPDYAFIDAPASNRNIERIDLNCNYLQLLEGGMDSSHVGILHKDQAQPEWFRNSVRTNDDPFNPGALATDDNAPALSIETTDFGFHYAAIRKLPNGCDSVRIVPFIMPSARVIPAHARVATLFEVPLDDENTSTYIIIHSPHEIKKGPYREISGIGESGLYSEDSFKWLGAWENRFGQDRDSTDRHWGGFRGIEQEDAAMALSMGPIFDRTKEHLVPADAAIVHTRRVLLTAARAVEAGDDPIPLPSVANVTGIADTDLAPGTPWQSLVPNHPADHREMALAELPE